MKKLLLLLVLNISLLVGAEKITEPLLKLLEVTGVQHQETHASIVQETQKKWLRPFDKERWEIPDLDDILKEKVFPLAEQLGFVNEILPTLNEYEYAALLGATCERMEKRLEFLIKLWNQGVHFKTLVFLTGQRPLDPTIEPIFEGCRTESEAARRIWSQHDIPEEMKKISAEFIEVPMKGKKRPTTQDTYDAWLSTNPKPSSLLLISNQPYCPYQHSVAVFSLPKDFHIETVGSSLDQKETNGSVLLDTIARWLYVGGK